MQDINALFDAHQAELIGHLNKIVKCSDTAADLAQESYLILFKTAQQQTIRHPRGFLYRIAVNLALNHLRRSKVAERYVQYLVTDEQENPSTEQLVMQQQRLQRFIRAVEALPPRCRDVIILDKIHGMSRKEIARELGITVSGVEKHITKGLSLVRQQLLNWEVE